MNRAIRATVLVPLVAAIVLPAAAAAEDGERMFELRVYTAEKGKMEALERRFRDHTLRLFEKHGIQVIGFWKPAAEEEAKNTLFYLLAFPSWEARDKAWSAFGNDPEWQKVYAESHRDGPLVKKIESTRLDPTDYSPLE